MREQLAAARRVCLDTNTLIYHLHRAEPYFELIQELLNSIRDGLRQGFVSVVTELELLVRPLREGDEREMDEIRAALDGPGMHIMDLDRGVAQIAAEVRAQTMLPLADAAIVATAIRAGCDAIVGNDRRCAQRVTEIPYVFLDALIKEHRP